MNRPILTELTIISVFSAWWFFFIATNVSPQLGNVYTGLVLGGAIIAIIDYLYGRRDVKFVNPNHSWVTVLISGLVAYALLILIATYVVPIIAEGISVSEALKLIAASTPVFAESVIINFLTFGIFIAFIETYALFVVGFDLLASMFKVEIDKKNLTNIKLWLIIFGISLLFLMLHVTAKGIEDNVALILVFFMAVISLVLTTIFKDARPAIILHIIANCLGMLSLLGIKLFNII